jgi:hypothetical protein
VQRVAHIDLVQFAHLSAALNAGSPRDELLAREGLSDEDWTRAQTLWLGKMAADATHFRFDTATRFNALVVGRRVPGASVGLEAKPEPDTPAGASAVASEPPEPLEDPGSDRAPETMGPAIEPPQWEAEDGPVTAPPVPNWSALPFQPAVPPPAPVQPPALQPPRPVQPAVVIPPVAPVAEPAAAAPPPAAAVPPQQPIPRLTLAQFAWMTAWISVAPGSIAEIRSRLGFDEAAHRAEVTAWQRIFENPALYASYRMLYDQCRAARIAGKAEAAPGWVPAAMRGFTHVDGTHPPDSHPLRSALPFRPAPQPQPAYPEPAPQPPAAAPLPAAPRLSLEQYARLCTELAFDPANRSVILQRYGVDEQQRQQLDAFWGVRVQLDDSLRKAWQDFCSAHRAELLRRTGQPTR